MTRRDGVLVAVRHHRPRVRRDRVLVALAGGYFAVAAVGVVAPATAEAVAHGRVWLLLTSALAAQPPLPLAQVGLTAAVAALAIRRVGAGAWWRAALVGHVGSALVAYALMLLAGAEAATREPDYGVSCVLGATLGALMTTHDRLGRAVGVVGAVALLPVSLSWLGIEHPLAVVLGALSARAAATR